MKRYNILFFIFFFLQFLNIFCQNNNSSLNSTSNKTQSVSHSDRPFNLTYEEMDTFMVCSLVVQESLKVQQKSIDEVEKRLNISKNKIYEKVGTEIYEKCIEKMDINDVHLYMENFTYHYNFKWDKKYETFTKLDFSKYQNITDLGLTIKQQVLVYKYQKIEQLYRQHMADQREFFENEDKKIKIGKFDLDSIPGYVKGIVFLVIFGLFFGGLFYLLGSLNKKNIGKKDKKDKRKKKTQ